ncbi:bifunctional 2',3'-cyclic-nucleotide 2'-phosphodiesterase/3'-nucleotidase [Frigidibacter sp. RF13]|uniref:bifunctional 2',3'-cyclic-nucleotide 2'-phosphodiesterase/3'-nucleotidase n=1 Tax=Frigidibacter sp. RF13 TaxID=2997340 RepID=UPI002270913B|nr:bifunctional 2',3'-cyclic-nucleotide 2'-phosphodiesterase/3'-nucleotidase [Frigidibacter sp. RF13]MCY1126365.1 bifunctional 2',3'-cyclic-nucleotide 2'-phosphodiesterase/3'-nucleotidase [Frigidibacter sp. RF13]
MADTVRGPQQQIYGLRILATSDIHAHVMPYDYAADRPLEAVGLARLTTLIRRARAEVANSITLDNGDFIEGSPLGELTAIGGQLPKGRHHPVVAAMNAVEYDAVGLGNHEFGYGVAFLERALEDAVFPVLSSNIARRLGATPWEDEFFTTPTLMLERLLINDAGRSALLKIGVLSLLPQQVETWERKHLAGRLKTRDEVGAAAAWAADLRRRGADIVVALCHSGIGGESAGLQPDNAAVQVARLGDIDVVIAGHTHRLFPGTGIRPTDEIDPAEGKICGKPAVEPGFRGSHLGIIDLDLLFRDGRWTVRSSQSRLEPVALRDSAGQFVARFGVDREVEHSVASCHANTVDYVRRPIGRADRALNSFFAPLLPVPMMDLIHAAQLSWLATVANAAGLSHLPRVSAASPFKFGGLAGPCNFTRIAAGDFLLRHIHDLYPFPNSIRAVRVTGAQMRDWLERAVSQYRQVVPGTGDQPLLHAEARPYDFDTVAGLSYDVDLSARARHAPDGSLVSPDARRIRNLRFQGAAVAASQEFLLVTNNFRAGGGGNYPELPTDSMIADPLALCTTVLRHFVESGANLGLGPQCDWRLTGVPLGTALWFDTHVDAAEHLHEALPLQVEVVGPAPPRFLRCRVVF